MLKSETLGFAFDLTAQRTVADEQRMGVRPVFVQSCDGANEVHRILVPNELRDLNDDRRVGGNAERRQLVSRCWNYNALRVDAVRHDVNAVRVHSARLENARDGVRHRDDRRRATVLPPRSRVVPQRKVHAPRYDQRHRRPERRQRADRDGVGRVRVNDVDFVFANSPPKPNRRGWVDLRPRAAVDDLESVLDRSSRKWLSETRSNGRPMSSARELTRKPQRLSLAAPPSALRVDVQHSVVHGAQLPARPSATQALIVPQ